MTHRLDTDKQRIFENIIKRYATAVRGETFDLLSLQKGKLYEGYVLARILRKMHQDNGFKIILRRSSHTTARLHLKSSGGHINLQYPYFEVQNAAGHTMSWVFTDVEFLSFSCCVEGRSHAPTPGDMHELDIAILVPPGNDPGWVPRSGEFPTFANIQIAVECKDTAFQKRMLREVLGVRRELGVLSQLQPTGLPHWPRATVPVSPPSCLVVYSSSASISRFTACGRFYAIEFCYAAI